eukprot:186905-Prymnesium_polylepis.1
MALGRLHGRLEAATARSFETREPATTRSACRPAGRPSVNASPSANARLRPQIERARRQIRSKVLLLVSRNASSLRGFFAVGGCQVKYSVRYETHGKDTELKPSPVELGGRVIRGVTYEDEVAGTVAAPFWQTGPRKGR